MSLLAKKCVPTLRDGLNEGEHFAICNAIVGIGAQPTPWGIKEKVYIRWEIPFVYFLSEKDGETVETPMTIWADYTLSLSNKANLRRALEGLYGRALNQNELDGFDLFDLIGERCILNVVHNEVGDRTYTSVQSINNCEETLEGLEQEIKSITYSQYATEQWNDVPEWLRRKIFKPIKENFGALLTTLDADDEPCESA